MVDNYDDPQRRRHVGRLSRLKLSWDDRRRRATALAKRLDDADAAAELLMGAIPDSWSGSRAPDLQALLDKLNDWKVDRSQVVLARAIAEAKQRLGKYIERERERDRLDDELMAWT